MYLRMLYLHTFLYKIVLDTLLQCIKHDETVCIKEDYFFS